jgi:hypothetical protein
MLVAGPSLHGLGLMSLPSGRIRRIGRTDGFVLSAAWATLTRADLQGPVMPLQVDGLHTRCWLARTAVESPSCAA